MNLLEVPGKIFLIGEYAVVEGGPSVLLPVRPGYRFETGIAEPHPDSPYGRYLGEFNPPVAERIVPVSGGPGPGLGSSTAELIAGARAREGSRFQEGGLLKWYKERFPRASGSDLLVQAQAGGTAGVLFSISKTVQASSFEPSPAIRDRLLFFRVPPLRKLATHLDLKKPRPRIDLEKTGGWTADFIRGLSTGGDDGLSAIGPFASYLSSLEMETPEARESRIALGSCEGVLAVKGCGAGLHDVFLVVMKSKPVRGDFERLEKTASGLGLSFLGDLGGLLW